MYVRNTCCMQFIMHIMCILNLLIVASSELSIHSIQGNIIQKHGKKQCIAVQTQRSIDICMSRLYLYNANQFDIYIPDQFCCKVFCLKYFIYNKRIINYLYCVRFVCTLEVCSLACHGHLCVNNTFCSVVSRQLYMTRIARRSNPNGGCLPTHVNHRTATPLCICDLRLYQLLQLV